MAVELPPQDLGAQRNQAKAERHRVETLISAAF
jgi:hypothetical protein